MRVCLRARTSACIFLKFINYKVEEEEEELQ